MSTPQVSSSPDPVTLRLPGEPRVERLDNGLLVGLLANPQAPVVTSVVWYRAGTRDEEGEHGGEAHFLEHMMFKGSPAYGPGVIDRRTQALGGTNNAFTSHDSTAYYFNFARDRWTEALKIEADRMAELTLDPREVSSERNVIVEEIAMYESEPWDALDQRVQARLFGAHPYGRPVLGTVEELQRTGADDLRRFHRRWYRPDNAVVVVAGDIDEGALEEVRRHLGGLGEGEGSRLPEESPVFPEELLRVERHTGEVARLLLALPAPAAGHPDHSAVRLLVTLLGQGRASRLYRLLVDEGKLCAWAMADVGETLAPGHLSITAELVPGVEPARVEAEVLARLAEMVAEPPTEEEVARARQILLADWVFGHERIHQQALTAAYALAFFDLEHPERELRRILELGREEMWEIAQRYLRPETGSVLGWSLPQGAR